MSESFTPTAIANSLNRHLPGWRPLLGAYVLVLSAFAHAVVTDEPGLLGTAVVVALVAFLAAAGRTTLANAQKQLTVAEMRRLAKSPGWKASDGAFPNASSASWGGAACLLAILGAAATAVLALPLRQEGTTGEVLYLSVIVLVAPTSLAVLGLAHWSLRSWLGPRPGALIYYGATFASSLSSALLALGLQWALMRELGLLGVGFPQSLWLLPVVGPVAWMLAGAVRHELARRWQHRVDEQTRRAEVAEHAQQLAEMRLALLQAQIEPHFLYNTLASVQYLVRKEPAIAEFLLTQLIRYLRQSMPTMRAQTSTLGREFELADAYLQIARVRMGARLDVGVELEESLHAIPFPPLMVQTLVENAIKHGIEPKAGQVRIDVTAQREGDRLIVAVIDNGVGLGGAPTAGGGTGLRNLRQRLAALYGDAAELQVASRNGSHHAAGVVSRLLVPLTPQDAPAGPATTDFTRSD